MTKQTEAMKLALVDDEGENQAVRMFLALYGSQAGITTKQMRQHLEMAGFDGAWPEWADKERHLTKAGAQLWIRHLFALAEQPAQQEPEQSDTARLDWLNNNFFSRENLDWKGNLSKESLMWVLFAPKGVQGDIRRVIDAAKLKELNTCTPAKYHNA